MKTKKLVFSLICLVLCATMMAFGVYAATTASFSLSGSVSFTASNVKVRVVARTVKSNTLYSTIATIPTTNTADQDTVISSIDVTSSKETGAFSATTTGSATHYVDEKWNLLGTANATLTLDDNMPYFYVVITATADSAYAITEAIEMTAANANWAGITVEQVGASSTTPLTAGTAINVSNALGTNSSATFALRIKPTSFSASSTTSFDFSKLIITFAPTAG